MNSKLQSLYDEIDEKITELINAEEDWIEDTLHEAKDDVLMNCELEEFAEKNNISNVADLLQSNLLDAEKKKEILIAWADSLSDLADIYVDVDL